MKTKILGLEKGILAFLSALTKDKRKQIIKRTNDDCEVAKTNDIKFGRKPKLDTLNNFPILC